MREGSLNYPELGAGVELHSLSAPLSQNKAVPQFLKTLILLFTHTFKKSVFRQCPGKESVVEEEGEGGGGVGEGQTKRQIVGSLDMSSSLHQTKEIH